MLFLISLILKSAFACDSTALTKQLIDNTGDKAAKAFTELAQCDASKAKRFAKNSIINFIGSEDGYQAALQGIRIGEEKYVLEWMNQQLGPDEQKQFLRTLGDACQKTNEVQNFFVNSAQNNTDIFWKNRYYQYVTDCRVEPIQQILEKQLQLGVDQGRPLYFAVASAYARNLEAKSIPLLAEQLSNTQEEEIQANLIVAMFEAVEESKKNHPEDRKLQTEANKLLIETLSNHAEKLTPAGILQARKTLTILEAEAESDALAGLYYAANKQSDDTFIWGVVVVENATCKKDKLKQNIFHAPIHESGMMWADQVEEKAKPSIEYGWDVNLATQCKGTSEILYFVPESPFANIDEYDAWAKQLIESQKNPEVKKTLVLQKEDLSL